jgi:hypothetical protein
MPFPALAALLPYLTSAAPYLGSAAAGYAGSALANLGQQSGQQQGGIGSGNGGNFLTGYPAQQHRLSNFNPNQTNMMNQLGQQGFKGLQGLNTSFEPIAQQARENFAQVGIPSIAERFTSGLGGGSKLQGGQRSSAFGQSLGQGAAGLESSLAAQQSQHNLGQQGHFKELLGLGLQPQFAQQLESAAPGLAQTLPGDLLKQLPSILLLLSQLGYFKGAEGAK